MSRFGAMPVDAARGPRVSRFGALAIQPPATTEPRNLREFIGEEKAAGMSPEQAIAGGFVDEFAEFLREKAEKLEPDSPERRELAKQIAGLRSDAGAFRAREAEAAKRGVSPETVDRLNSPAGAAEQSIAQTAVGQTLMRAEQGLSNIAETGLSMASRSLGSGKLSAAIHRDKALRDEFLTKAEQGGQIESLLGESGSRVYNSVVGSVAKFSVAGMAGPAAVYSLIAGESFDDGLEEAKQNGLEGKNAVAYASTKAVVETGLTFLMGKVGKRLGLATFEETLSPGMRAAAAKLAGPTIGKRLAREAASAGLEVTEETLIDAVQQGVELYAGTSRKFDWRRLLEAGAAGAVSRGATGAVGALESLRKIPAAKIEETVKGVTAAEQALGIRSALEQAESAGREPGSGGRGARQAKRFFETATPEIIAEARKPLSQKDFARVTGLKKTSKVFRDTFRETLDLYAGTLSVPAETGRPAPDAAPVASEGLPPTTESDSAGAPQTAATEPTKATPQNPGEIGGTTSARRTHVDATREALGLPAIPDAESRPWEVALETAQQNGVPARALSLARDINAAPRALTDVETAGLVVRMRELETSADDLQKRMDATQDATELRILGRQFDAVEQEYNELSRAARTSGTEKGRNLAAQKLTINRNYSLVSVLSQAQAKRDGDPLTPEQREKFTPLVNKENRTNKRLKTVTDKADRHSREAAHREVVRLRSAVSEIRKLVGLDNKATISAEVPALSDADRAQLDQLAAKLAEAESALATVEIPETGPVHNRPGEKPVSDLDDAVARARAAIRRKMQPKDSNADEQRRIARLEKQLAEAQETLRRAREGEEFKRDQRRADVMSKQRDKLYYELQQVRRDIRDAIRGVQHKSVWHHAQTATDIARGLMTSIDYSALGRQAKFAVWSHPFIAAKNIPAMFKAGWSDRMAWDIEQEILSRPNAPLYELGMTIHRRDAELTDREEAFATKLLEKPIEIGGRRYWNPVAGSQRAYVAFLNRMRADVFDAQAKLYDLETPEQFRELGRNIDVLTGRGGFAAADKHMRSASLVLFAPRFLMSRIQYAIGEPVWNTRDPRVRRIMVEEYARSFAGAALWYSLYALAFGDSDDFSITFDPRSTDFGKIVLGNTRVDPLGGLAQVVRFGTRMIMGQTVDERGRVKELTPAQKWGEVSRFARSKASPFVGQALNFMVGEDLGQNPVNVSSVEGVTNLVGGTFIPLSVRDIAETMQEQGIPRGTALSILNMFGEGLMTYGVKK